MSAPGKSRVVAGFVSIAGVIAIWAFSAARQSEQTEAVTRAWLGEQWDVARRCLVGTPIGRSEGVEVLRARLERELVSSLASDARWPARCAGLLRSLRADRSILRADPGDALAALEVLVPRVLPHEESIDVRGAAERARELAEPIARLDAAMPSGAEYDPQDFARSEPGMPADVVLASLACADPAGGGTPSDPSTPSDATGGAAPSDASLPSDVAAGAAARGSSAPSCASAEALDRPGRIVACSDRLTVTAWRQGDAWRGTICEGDRCAAMPPLGAGADLALAVAGRTVLALGRAARSDLPLAWALPPGGRAWSEPVPVARGALSVAGGAFRIAPCEGPAWRSEDGLRWTEVP